LVIGHAAVAMHFPRQEERAKSEEHMLVLVVAAGCDRVQMGHQYRVVLPLLKQNNG
jgi:hypothetical protein